MPTFQTRPRPLSLATDHRGRRSSRRARRCRSERLAMPRSASFWRVVTCGRGRHDSQPRSRRCGPSVRQVRDADACAPLAGHRIRAGAVAFGPRWSHRCARLAARGDCRRRRCEPADLLGAFVAHVPRRGGRRATRPPVALTAGGSLGSDVQRSTWNGDRGAIAEPRRPRRRGRRRQRPRETRARPSRWPAPCPHPNRTVMPVDLVRRGRSRHRRFGRGVRSRDVASVVSPAFTSWRQRHRRGGAGPVAGRSRRQS
jgi:hypothetical protein